MNPYYLKISTQFIDILKVNYLEYSQEIVEKKVIAFLSNKENLVLLNLVSNGRGRSYWGQQHWMETRNKMAYCYLYYWRQGEFPKSFDRTSLLELLDIEEMLQNYTYNAQTRGFLIAFYWKILKIKYEQNILKEDILSPLSLAPLLNKMQFKSPYIDWIVLCLLFLVQEKGQKEVMFLLERKEFFLKEILQKKMTGLLGYAATIQEVWPFVPSQKIA